jgi:hypothetical protein
MVAQRLIYLDVAKGEVAANPRRQRRSRTADVKHLPNGKQTKTRGC